ncbi:hypothetical protein [Aquiflexum gelatinilyticum]|uniref:DUF2946 domain-containing protein n=1 Tax=Aquiflexum gelatinilyticum TaxID=2961943 RepID=A0A9X2T053_9BACT|nr:hypothetical protein [Aquiflexum gelatinilyticum]MCR9015288.1 hypothetical protein [Aquiflexum gelatinilyticum]
MIKRYFSLFFLALSTLMMLGHSIIPHQHHGSLDKSHHNHHSDKVEIIGLNTADHHSILDNVFSFVPHGQKGVECISCPNMDETFNKQYFDFNAIIPVQIQFNYRITDIQQFFFDYPDALLITRYFPPVGLRAPPFFS